MAGTGTAHLRDESEVILRAEDLVVEFPVGRTGLKVHAVSGISLDVKEGETLGLVGESGCGKTTTGRCILQLERPTSGEVIFEGRELTKLGERDLRAVRRKMQVIFQDPY
ncbi:MAG TPA: ATP-binding cassette domain-containing protein, partial [Acidimicrobiales bacterium]|nr:ATP-binding cassette domain-containing protein [Acidimicrobiales bacterium]